MRTRFFNESAEMELQSQTNYQFKNDMFDFQEQLDFLNSAINYLNDVYKNNEKKYIKSPNLRKIGPHAKQLNTIRHDAEKELAKRIADGTI